MKRRGYSGSHLVQMQCRGVPGCQQEKIVTPETRKIFLKGLLVWVLFSLGAHLYLTRDIIVILLHSVGFGFFLMITTRKTRWLGALALGIITFVAATYQLIPPEWMTFSYNVIGYTGLAAVFILGVVCRTVQKPEMIFQSEFLTSVGFVGSKYFNLPFGADTVGTEETAEQVLMRINKVKLCRVLMDMDARLMETEHDMKLSAEEKARLQATNQRLRKRIDNDVSRRLVAEKMVSEGQDNVKTLRKRCEAGEADVQELQGSVSRLKFSLKRSKASNDQLQQQVAKLSEQLETKMLAELPNQKSGRQPGASRSVGDGKQDTSDCLRRLKKQEQVTLAYKTKSEEMKANCAAQQDTIEQLQNRVKALVAETRILSASKIELGGTLEKYRKREEEWKQKESQLRKTLDQTRARAEATTTGDDAKAEPVSEVDAKKVVDLELVGLHETGGEQLESLEAVKIFSQLSPVDKGCLKAMNIRELNTALKLADRNVMTIREIYERQLHLQNEQLKKKVEKRMCCVCLDAEIQTICNPCGHFCTCKKCAESLKQCPICRERITSVKIVFYS